MMLGDIGIARMLKSKKWETTFGTVLDAQARQSMVKATMIKDAGMSIDHAATVTAMFQLGGTIGAILVGLAMDRFGATRTIAIAYFFGAISLVALGIGGLQSTWLALVVGIVGFCMSGGQTGLNAFAPGCYPTLARATGVSWMLGVGRLGSILGSSIGGVLLSFGWSFQGIFSSLAVPACLAALAILCSTMALRAEPLKQPI